MKKTLFTLLTAAALLLPSLHAVAHGGGSACADRKKGKKPAAAKPTAMADLAENDYDIKHLRFDLRMSDTSIYVQGNVATTAQVTAATMNDYVFELSNSFTIDSARVNGIMLPVTTTGSVRRITMPITLTAGSMFTARIWYRGMPPTGSGFFNGITHTVSTGGTHMVYTVSDPWVALNWWPCKQSVLDQADSVDMFVTVPEGVVDGSPGHLMNVDQVSTPGYWTYHWKTNYSIDYYLISLAIARYSEYKNYVHFTDGSGDSVLVQNFFMDTASFNPAHKHKFDSVGHMINYFSSLLGRYPFWQEKFGMCFTTLGGGMEHQTMVTIGVTDVETIAHELMHQWFGDHVTYRSWRDMWLSEGFASYAEHLYREQFHGAGPAKQRRQEHLTRATSRTCGRTYLTDTTTSDSLFTYDQYYKASIILHTLRYMAPHDSIFFKTLRTYQSTYGFSNASTADFKAVAEAVYGRNLDTFFNQWIYGRGYPQYKTYWNQVGSKVYVKLVQSGSCASYTKLFATPVQIQLRAGTIDTFIKVYNNVDTQTYAFDWTPTVTNVILNPDIWVVMRNLSTTKDASLLGMGAIERGNLRIYPNPTEDNWQIEQLPGDTGLALMDMTGKVLWEGHSTQGYATVPAGNLPAGNYLLRLTGGISDHIKLVRW